jgi:hypothetical protein
VVSAVGSTATRGAAAPTSPSGSPHGGTGHGGWPPDSRELGSSGFPPLGDLRGSVPLDQSARSVGWKLDPASFPWAREKMLPAAQVFAATLPPPNSFARNVTCGMCRRHPMRWFSEPSTAPFPRSCCHRFQGGGVTRLARQAGWCRPRIYERYPRGTSANFLLIHS